MKVQGEGNAFTLIGSFWRWRTPPTANAPKLIIHSYPSVKKMLDDDLSMMDEPTGRVDDEWSLIGSQRPQMDAWSVLQSDAGDPPFDIADWDDCQSEASSAVFSVTSTATARSCTAVYGDHLLDNDTATTNAPGGLVPLASLPPGAFIARRNIITDDSASEVSVTTRRGWPRYAASTLFLSPASAHACSYPIANVNFIPAHAGSHALHPRLGDRHP